MNTELLVGRIDAILPQTQCGQCGYPGCKPYARALASQEADINQCPPGGDAGIHALADLLGQRYKPLNPQNGVHKPKALAVIDEAACIGCTLCIQACPVDAILGASKQMHTIIAAECTGCELCLPPCPVDCITLHVPDTLALTAIDIKKSADIARKRHENRLARIARQSLTSKSFAAVPEHQVQPASSAAALKKAAIAAAMAKARSQKNDAAG